MIRILFIVKDFSLNTDNNTPPTGELPPEEFYRAIVDNAPVWINVLDANASVLLWNRAAERISGYTRDEVSGHDGIWAWLYPEPAYRAQIQQKVAEVLRSGKEVRDFETQIRCKSGETKIINWHSLRFFGTQGQLIGSCAIGMDVTTRRQAETEQEESERQLHNLMTNLPGMAYRCRIDQSWTMLFISDGCRELTGYLPDELINNAEQAFADIIHPDDVPALWKMNKDLRPGDPPFSDEYRIRRKDGSTIWVWERGCVIQQGTETLLEGIILDINERKQMEQEMAYLASHDSLTGLINRHELMKRLESDLDRAARYTQPLGLLLLDVDHFKPINDNYGHKSGDQVLQRLGTLLRDNIRTVDYAARYGGEEMVIVLPEIELDEACDLAERLRLLIEQSPLFDSAAAEQRVTVSIGVASFPSHGSNSETLLQAADEAMYRAKQRGRNQVEKAV